MGVSFCGMVSTWSRDFTWSRVGFNPRLILKDRATFYLVDGRKGPLNGAILKVSRNDLAWPSCLAITGSFDGRSGSTWSFNLSNMVGRLSLTPGAASLDVSWRLRFS